MPLTSILPTFGSDLANLDTSPSPLPTHALVASADELEQLARSVQGDVPVNDADSTALAADLVAEAVATYKEQRGDEPVEDAPEAGMSSARPTSHRWPRPWSTGNGSRWRTWRRCSRSTTGVRPEHRPHPDGPEAGRRGRPHVGHGPGDGSRVRRPRHSSASTSSKLGTIPEATARHHNVIVIGSEDGVAGRGRLQSHRRLRHGRPPDHHGPQLQGGRGHPHPDQLLHRQGLQQRERRRRHGHGGVARLRRARAPDAGVDDIQAVTEEAPIVRYVNLLILQALNERASDIHVEPTGPSSASATGSTACSTTSPPRPGPSPPAVTTRLKVMADMNVAEHRDPAGRPHLAQRREQGDRPPDGDPAHHPRREGRHAGTRQVERGARLRLTSGSTRTCSRPTRASTPSPTGPSW